MMELRLAYDANDLSRFEKVRPHTTAIPSKHAPQGGSDYHRLSGGDILIIAATYQGPS
jgi:uncharacterized heparinase superfamily protein